MNILKAFFITIYFNTTFQAVGQQSLFDHPQAMELVGKGTESIYKLKGDSAKFYIRELKKLLPNHPVVPSMEAFLIQWENIPIIEGQIFVRLEAKLREAVVAAENFNVLDPHDEDAVFFELATRGLLAEYYAENKNYFEAITEANKMYGLIKIGSEIGAITTILLIFTTAIVGVYYAKYEGLNTLRAGFAQLRQNETPTYEMLSGATIAFAALLLIIPGFATDILGAFCRAFVSSSSISKSLPS